jgi:hypothetical protein
MGKTVKYIYPVNLIRFCILKQNFNYKTNNHLSSYLTEMNTKKGTGKYDFEIQILALDRNKEVAQ